MNSNFLLYHKVPRMPGYNSAESGTGDVTYRLGTVLFNYNKLHLLP